MTTNTYGGYTVAQLREFIRHHYDAEHGGDNIDELTRDNSASVKIVRDLLDAIEPQRDGDLLRPVARWVYNAVRVNLDLLHGICMEFGCQPGDDVALWLRDHLSSIKSPAPEQASEATAQRQSTENPTAEDILGSSAGIGNGTSSKVSRADALTAPTISRDAFYDIVRAAMKKYRGDNPSRYLNDDQVDANDGEFVRALADQHAKLITGRPVEQHEAAPASGMELAFSSAAMSRRDELELPGATVYIDRFVAALGLLCRSKPPKELCEQWLNGESDELQSWTIDNRRIYWQTGIGAIEAAQHLADNPEEGEGHEGFTSDYVRDMAGAQPEPEAPAMYIADTEWPVRQIGIPHPDDPPTIMTAAQPEPPVADERAALPEMARKAFATAGANRWHLSDPPMAEAIVRAVLVARASLPNAAGAEDLNERAMLAAGQWATSDTPIAEALAYRDGFIAGARAPRTDVAGEYVLVRRKPTEADIEALGEVSPFDDDVYVVDMWDLIIEQAALPFPANPAAMDSDTIYSPPSADAAAAPAYECELPMMRKAFRVTEVSGDPDPAKQRFAMRFSFPSIEAMYAADDEWNKFIASGPADAQEPVAWVRKHPDTGELSGDWLWNDAIEQCRKDSGVWFPLGFLAVGPGGTTMHECMSSLLDQLDEARTYAARYSWLRDRSLDAINAGGVFAGKTPDNVVLNGADLDAAIDAESGIRFYGKPADAQAVEAATWRELARRLYVELFHCDQQMRSTRDEDGEPHWTQSSVVRDVLADAKAALDAVPQPSSADAAAAPADAQAEQPVAIPERTRALLLNVLWHHQGGKSTIGQPIREMLGIGPHDHLTGDQLTEAKRIEKLVANKAMEDVLQAENDLLRADLKRRSDVEAGHVWHWIGDGTDALESLNCQVIIKATDLRALLDAPQPPAPASAPVGLTAEATDCGCATNEACKMKADGSCWRAD
ncbi:hypothetical protein [Burkholderia sp. Ac-20344]|uniref:hypothetical protein n=1 Tax=Burkholderia sp. Ac-20344 TaxID=2703890 RepID=UPI00197C6065|nr:hypothetical protein [Burkholderia sp. Ac-20344]MBN3832906.1 hypothetical protein [Burkholderia sp. Ac-20344]